MDPLASYQAELAKEQTAARQAVPEMNLAAGGQNPTGAPTPPPPPPPPVPPVPPVSPSFSAMTPPPRRNWLLWGGIAVLVLALIGGGAYWFAGRNAVQPATETTEHAASPYEISNLLQLVEDEELAAGDATQSKQITLQFDIPAWHEAVELTPQVELRPVGEPFTGEATTTGEMVTATDSEQSVKVAVEVTADGGYHWQARVTSTDEEGEWVTYSTDTEAAEADFVVDATAPAAPTVSSVGSAEYVSGVSVTATKPGFVGKAEPGSQITIELQPGGTKLTTTADSQGSWSVQTRTELDPASYTATVTASDAAGNSATQSLAFSVGDGTTASSGSADTPTYSDDDVAVTEEDSKGGEFAATGDNTQLVTLLSLLMLAVALGGLSLARKHAAK